VKTILFSPITFNLAETTRAIAIARAIAADFQCHFSSYGGVFEILIEKEGFPLTKLEPRFTPQMIKRIYAIDQGRWHGPSHTADFVRQMVRGELALCQRLQPAAVVTGMNPSTCISCPAVQIPLVWIIQSGMAMNTAARLGRLKDMDLLDAAPIRWLPDNFRAKLSQILLDSIFTLAAQLFNQVAAEYGLKPFRCVEDLIWSGYPLLVAEPPGFSDIHLPSNAHFIGPLIARLDMPLPEEVLKLPRDRPIIYFAMGSSGRADVIARILAGFAGKPYRVIAPVKNLLGEQPVSIPDNVLVTSWLPAYKANRLADLSVIHGGIGTIMTACLAGKPVVGVAMSPEQFLNLENLATKGFSTRISQNRLSAASLCQSIERLLADSLAQEKAREYQKVVEAWDNPQYIRRFFCETFGPERDPA
jgi:UDP:flavonoid glycosyltransferase YjiC (YdhE family)